MAARKKWKTRAMGGGLEDKFSSEAKAYDFVNALRSAWKAGSRSTASIIDVYVDEGRGWEHYERLNFADET